ncbi:unnamed protein product [Caenorhabditis bovis]|uniref:Uncharacterized protein n=1 Tax=Caenorhabditis bovis TaxID=2654633 RepID=A0A8S1F7I5_9PELO|nr:unnamed protein product [Caenorhabditis bovis]
MTTTTRKRVSRLPLTMETKRPRTCEDVKLAELLGKMRNSSSRDEAKQAGSILKALLNTEERIRKFVENEENFDALVAIFIKHASNLKTDEHNCEILQYSISILGNCCHVVPETGFSVKKLCRNFWELGVRILENSSMDIKTSLCKLIANICLNKELALSWISSKTLTFDNIAALLDSEDMKLVRQCIRVFQVLANASLTREKKLSRS